jgi:hypothetical protein
MGWSDMDKKKVKNEKKNDKFPWLSGKKKELSLDEIVDIEELLEDDD